LQREQAGGAAERVQLQREPRASLDVRLARFERGLDGRRAMQAQPRLRGSRAGQDEREEEDEDLHGMRRADRDEARYRHIRRLLKAPARRGAQALSTGWFWPLRIGKGMCVSPFS